MSATSHGLTVFTIRTIFFSRPATDACSGGSWLPEMDQPGMVRW